MFAVAVDDYQPAMSWHVVDDQWFVGSVVGRFVLYVEVRIVAAAAGFVVAVGFVAAAGFVAVVALVVFALVLLETAKLLILLSNNKFTKCYYQMTT